MSRSIRPRCNGFRAARLAKGWTQSEVARRTGFAQSVISDLETAVVTNPTWEVLGRLAVLYGCRPDELIPFPKLPRRGSR